MKRILVVILLFVGFCSFGQDKIVTSADSLLVFGDTLITTSQLKTPTLLSLQVISSSEIKINWYDNSAYESGYYVQRSLNGYVFTTVYTSAANVITYNNTGLTAATNYYYRVIAFNGTNLSVQSNYLNATTSP